MNQSEGLELGCVCPECSYRCKACLGTNSVVSRENLKDLANNPFFLEEIVGEKEIPVRPGRNEIDEYLD
jgi:hypothetical protein